MRGIRLRRFLSTWRGMASSETRKRRFTAETQRTQRGKGEGSEWSDSRLLSSLRPLRLCGEDPAGSHSHRVDGDVELDRHRGEAFGVGAGLVRHAEERAAGPVAVALEGDGEFELTLVGVDGLFAVAVALGVVGVGGDAG